MEVSRRREPSGSRFRHTHASTGNGLRPRSPGPTSEHKCGCSRNGGGSVSTKFISNNRGLVTCGIANSGARTVLTAWPEPSCADADRGSSKKTATNAAAIATMLWFIARLPLFQTPSNRVCDTWNLRWIKNLRGFAGLVPRTEADVLWRHLVANGPSHGARRRLTGPFSTGIRGFSAIVMARRNCSAAGRACFARERQPLGVLPKPEDEIRESP